MERGSMTRRVRENVVQTGGTIPENIWYVEKKIESHRQANYSISRRATYAPLEKHTTQQLFHFSTSTTPSKQSSETPLILPAKQAYTMGSCLSTISTSPRASPPSISASRRASLSSILTSPCASPVRTVNDKDSPLYVLPMEILQYISATFLPPDAAASLALCSHLMLRILGTQAFHSLRLECHSIERTRFLKNLENDLPDWLFCHCCSRFHPVDQNEDPSQRWHFFDETKCARVNGIVSIDYDFNIRFEHVQLIMRNFRLGRPYKIHLDRLSKKYARHLRDASLETVVTADIVEGELLIHIEQMLRPLRDWDISLIRVNLPRFCPHLIELYRDSIFAQTLRCRLSHANGFPCLECKKRKHCRECSTSYQVDIRTLENLVTEVHVDIWKCLGSCESSFDPKWRRQADRYLPTERLRNRNDQKLTRKILPMLEA